jgi:hypothetical protein
MHVKGALRKRADAGGRSDEVLLQVGIYCAWPAAVDSFRSRARPLNE